MNPRIGKRSNYNQQAEQPLSKAAEFIIRNTKKSITLKQEYLYLEDVKTAINIHHLEHNIKLKRWLISQLKNNPGHVITLLENSVEKDRHNLQKKFRVTL